jgi:bile acid-coenzyme A ligase
VLTTTIRHRATASHPADGPVTQVSIAAALARLAMADPGAVAVTCADVSITRAEVDAHTNRLARAYAARGVGPGDFVTIALPNSIEFIAACVATWKLGATPQPISSRLPALERDEIVALARPALVAGAASDGAAATVPAGFEPGAEFADAPLPDATAPSWKASTSGGSTGRPKVIVDARPGVVELDEDPPYGIRADGVALVPGPLYHTAPFTCAMSGLFAGTHVVVMERFDPVELLALVEGHRVDLTMLVPTMMHRIWQLPAETRQRYDVSSLRVVWHIGAPCAPWLKEAWIDWLGAKRIWELYGGTERQAYTVIRGDEWLAHRGSVGRPAFGEVRVVDEAGRDVKPGTVGLVRLRAPHSEPTYRYVGAEPDVVDGWDTLGDLGWLDEDGYLYIADRRTDLILSGGANVYPAEIEAALDAHPQVRSSAVVGLPDDDLGQRVHAIVESGDPADGAEILRFLRERLAPYKVPRSIEFVDHPLRDDAGKVRRAALRDQRTP